MNYRHLSLCCQCGAVPESIDEVGFSDQHELVVHWWCAECKRVVYVAKQLSECWRDCPRADRSLDAALTKLEGKAVYNEDDASFLRSVGVSTS